MLNRVDRIMPYAFPVIIALLGVGYYFINPTIKGHPLQCPWHLLTGTQCPACGSQRALHALVHGHWLEALRYNYLFVLSVPYAMIAVVVSWYNFGHRLDGLKRLAFHPITLKAYVIIFFAWWIGRNLIHV